MAKAKAKSKTKPKTKTKTATDPAKPVDNLADAEKVLSKADSVCCYNHKNDLTFFCKSSEEAKAFFSFNTVTKHNVYFGISYPTPEQEAEAKRIITEQAEAVAAVVVDQTIVAAANEIIGGMEFADDEDHATETKDPFELD
jgi:hypothetical protein